MSAKNLSFLIVAILVSLGAVFFLLTSQNSEQDTETIQTQSQTKIYTLKEVESHNSEDDCWTVIQASVYDITSYIPRHPGGDEILRACGEDATTMFTSRVNESGNEIGSGTPHSSSAESQLARLKIGSLQQ